MNTTTTADTIVSSTTDSLSTPTAVTGSGSASELLNKPTGSALPEGSLTAPCDRNREKIWRPDIHADPLSREETLVAKQELCQRAFTRVERSYVDPVVNMQNFALFSFVPAQGSRPNDSGIYGFAKIRGSYATEMEADQRAEYIIKNVDSYNKIYTTYVGRPFPVTVSSNFCDNINEVDIQKQAQDAISKNIRTKRDEEKQIMNEIKAKEKALIEDAAKTEEDPYDRYITLMVKKAQAQWTYLENEKRLEELKNSIVRTRKEIAELDSEYPEYRNSYMEKYMEARKQAGLPDESVESMRESFLRYLVEDAKLPF